ARRAAPRPRRCAPWRPASWWCPGRCPPRGAAGAARAIVPVPKFERAPSGSSVTGFDYFIGVVYFFSEPVEEHELPDQRLCSHDVLLRVDLLGDLPFDFAFLIRKAFPDGIKSGRALRLFK